MPYTQALKALEEVRTLLQTDGHFKTSYTVMFAAITNKVAALAKTEQLKKASK